MKFEPAIVPESVNSFTGTGVTDRAESLTCFRLFRKP